MENEIDHLVKHNNKLVRMQDEMLSVYHILTIARSHNEAMDNISKAIAKYSIAYDIGAPIDEYSFWSIYER